MDERKEYIERISKELDDCTDVTLLDLILKLLTKSK